MEILAAVRAMDEQIEVNSLAEIAVEVKSTDNNRKLGEAIDLLQLGVVGNLVGAVDGG